MACNECKKKNDQSQQNGETTFAEGDPDVIDLVPKSLVGPHLDQNFVLKFVVFISIGVMLPFIILALFYQLFMTFFFPSFLSKFNTKVTIWVKNLFNKYAKYRADK